MGQTEGLFDMHSHILPGVDDGARTMEHTKEMIDMAYEQGVRHIVATSHYIEGENRYTAKKLADCFGDVKKIEQERHPDLQLYLGNEIFYSASIVESLKRGDIQTYNGGKYVLVEFFTGISYKEMRQAMRNILYARYIPVLAHMERFECLYKQGERVEELRQMGVLLQMNVGSIVGGMFDGRVRQCRKLILNGDIQLLGTDMHHPKHRPPRMDEAMEWIDKKVPGDLRNKLLYKNPRKVLNIEEK